jgi:hypothetical protein
VQNPDLFPILEKKIREEGLRGSKAFFYAIWEPKKGLRERGWRNLQNQSQKI